jgi:hypothetical protein
LANGAWQHDALQDYSLSYNIDFSAESLAGGLGAIGPFPASSFASTNGYLPVGLGLHLDDSQLLGGPSQNAEDMVPTFDADTVNHGGYDMSHMPPSRPHNQSGESSSAMNANVGRGQQSFTCITCGEDFLYNWRLEDHGVRLNHPIKKCPAASCAYVYNPKKKDWREHMRSAHGSLFECDECSYMGKSQYELALHASSSGHASFACEHEDCEGKFARVDTYYRHAKTHKEDAKRYPCKYCKKYRGENGFKRKDHLTQHIRNYHHIDEGNVKGGLAERKWCPKIDCPYSALPPYDAQFQNSAQWVKHMRTVHNESTFPCPRPGCDRIEGKGYYRKGDLRNHLRKVHGINGDAELEDNLGTL